MMHLDISQNMLGYLSVPEGWESRRRRDSQIFKPPGGKWGNEAPLDAKPIGIIAVANAIKDMGAISVKVYGLQSAQHLNGLTGRIQEDLPNGRRVVQLENGEQKSLKPANLEIITSNGTMTGLDLASNDLGVEGGKIIGGAIKVIN
jgi:hypothetical protein